MQKSSASPRDTLSSAASAADVAETSLDRETAFACLSIAKELPEYFTEDGLSKMRDDLREGRLYVAGGARQPDGFAALKIGEGRAEILWMAVRRERQRRGIGAALMERIVEDLRRSGEFEFLSVKTLAEVADYPPYEATRSFYERMGFKCVETLDPCPGWAGGDPCAVYERRI